MFQHQTNNQTMASKQLLTAEQQFYGRLHSNKSWGGAALNHKRIINSKRHARAHCGRLLTIKFGETRLLN